MQVLCSDLFKIAIRDYDIKNVLPCNIAEINSMEIERGTNWENVPLLATKRNGELKH